MQKRIPESAYTDGEIYLTMLTNNHNQGINDAKASIQKGQLTEAYIRLEQCLSSRPSRENVEEIIRILLGCKESLSRDILLSRAYMAVGEHEVACNRLLRHILSPKLSEKTWQKLLTELNKLRLDQVSSANKTREFINKFYFGEIAQSDNPSTPGMTAVKKKNFLVSSKENAAVVQEDFFIEFLKHFSSYTPIMRRRDRNALGGGYFVALGGYNIVVDPGHHFLDNFFGANYRILDINAVVVTHFHDDHYADLSALLSLFHKHSRENNDYRVDLFLDETTKKMFQAIIEKSKYVRKKVCLTEHLGKTIVVDEGIWLAPLPTFHDILGLGNTGVGFLLQIDRMHHKNAVLITGDTGWSEKLEGIYRKIRCENERLILVPHISSIHLKEIPNLVAPGRSEPHQNHLCIYGLCKAIEASKPDMVILSEIGEELADSTKSLCALVKKVYDKECLIGQKKDGKPLRVYLDDGKEVR